MSRVFYLLVLNLTVGIGVSFGNPSILASGTAGSTKWEITSPLNFVPAAGFIPVTISATNRESKALRATYSFASHDFYYGTNATTVAAGALDIPALQTASATHWIWRGSNFRRAESQSRVSVSVNTPSGRSEDSLRGIDRESGASIAFSRAFLTSKDLAPGRSGHFVYTPSGVDVAILDPRTLPPDWRALSSLYALYLTPADWDDLPPGVRDAIRTWIGFGGTVGIVGQDRAAALRAADALAPSDVAFGIFATADPVSALVPSELMAHVKGLQEFETAFAIGVPATELDLRSRNRRGSFRQRTNRTGRNQSFPLRDSFGRREIPYLAICMLLFGFAVLVGPASLRLWAGPGKRHRLFLTTPIFSIAASALLLVVMLFQDGLGIKGRRFTVVDLAPANRSQPEALVYQEQFARAGMVSGGGFPIEQGLMPIIPVETIETTLAVRGDQAVGPWISSRRDSSLAFAGAVPLRWRISHDGASEDSLQLHIEAPVREFEDAWFVDGDGLVWKWDGKADGDGGNMRFIPATRNAKSVMEPMFERCSTNLRLSILKRLDRTGHRNRFWGHARAGALAARASHPKIKWLESPLILTSKVTPPN